MKPCRSQCPITQAMHLDREYESAHPGAWHYFRHRIAGEMGEAEHLLGADMTHIEVQFLAPGVRARIPLRTGDVPN